MDDLIFGVEPFHVIISVIGIGGAIIGFQLKINRCIGRLESSVSDLDSRLKTIAESYLGHLDKKDR